MHKNSLMGQQQQAAAMAQNESGVPNQQQESSSGILSRTPLLQFSSNTLFAKYKKRRQLQQQQESSDVSSDSAITTSTTVTEKSLRHLLNSDELFDPHQQNNANNDKSVTFSQLVSQNGKSSNNNSNNNSSTFDSRFSSLSSTSIRHNRDGEQDDGEEQQHHEEKQKHSNSSGNDISHDFISTHHLTRDQPLFGSNHHENHDDITSPSSSSSSSLLGVASNSANGSVASAAGGAPPLTANTSRFHYSHNQYSHSVIKLRSSNIAFYFLLVLLVMILFSMMLLFSILYGQRRSAQQHLWSGTGSQFGIGKDQHSYSSPEELYFSSQRHNSHSDSASHTNPLFQRKHSKDYPDILSRKSNPSIALSNRKYHHSDSDPLDDIDLSDLIDQEHSSIPGEDLSGSSPGASHQKDSRTSDAQVMPGGASDPSSHTLSSSGQDGASQRESHHATGSAPFKAFWNRAPTVDHVIYYGDNVLIAPPPPATNPTPTTAVQDATSLSVKQESDSSSNSMTATSSRTGRMTKAKSSQLYWIQKNDTMPLYDANLKCRNTVQGKNWITDSRGVMCETFDVDPDTMCCKDASLHSEEESQHSGAESDDSSARSGSSGLFPTHRAKQYNCDACQMSSGCCREFEGCVSCCMKDLDRARKVYADIMETSRTENNEENFKAYYSVRTLFQFCEMRCRTNSQSVVNENKYRSEFKHCFG